MSADQIDEDIAAGDSDLQSDMQSRQTDTQFFWQLRNGFMTYQQISHTQPHLRSQDFRNRSLSIIIPAHNEAARIRECLDAVNRFCAPILRDYEIIVVDDGSTDLTAEIVAAHARSNPSCSCISLSTNEGKGAAICKGIMACRKDAVLFFDADLSTDLNEIPRFLQLLDRADIIIGSRYLSTSRATYPQGALRRWLGMLFATFVRRMGLIELADTQCGFKMMRTACAREIFSRTTIRGFAFDVEILCIAQLLGFQVREAGVHWTDQPGSTVRVIRDGAKMLVDLLRIKRHVARGDYLRARVIEPAQKKEEKYAA